MDTDRIVEASNAHRAAFRVLCVTVSLTDDPHAAARAAADVIRERFGIPPTEHIADLAFVLGSGWSAGTEVVGDRLGECELAQLPGFSAPVVPGHGGKLLLTRTAAAKRALIFTGRTHLYEGRGVEAVVHGVRTAAAAGVHTIVLTNGSGGLNPDWAAGTPVLISDHINLTGATPLRGGSFIDLSEAYSARLRDLARQVWPQLPGGVYCQFHGPQYETPAEVRMAGRLGADLVGMSTALETVAAREAGIDVLGISLVANHAAGISPTPLSHADVTAAGRAAAPRLRSLLSDLAGLL